MAAPKTTIWEIEPHTLAKHEILKRYLQAWVPILATGGFPEVMYVDGFAGPGRYSKGEDGSPVIALRAALEQDPRPTTGTRFCFLFVEQELERARVLQEIVEDINDRGFSIRVAGGETFETAFGEFLHSYKSKGRRLPPIFAFIDPFGWKGIPFSIIKEIMEHRSCEVLITFMYEEINRFIEQENQGRNFDSLFGTEKWRGISECSNKRDRCRFLHDTYRDQLRGAAGVKYVRSFEMRNEKDVVDYYLFYATNNILGLRKMKAAMWKVDEASGFRFSDATDPNQLLMFKKEPDYDILRRQILDRFRGRIATVGEIEEFVLAETAFRETHYKVQVLRSLECSQSPSVEAVDPPPDRRVGTYGDPSLRLRFLSSRLTPRRLL